MYTKFQNFLHQFSDENKTIFFKETEGLIRIGSIVNINQTVLSVYRYGSNFKDNLLNHSKKKRKQKSKKSTLIIKNKSFLQSLSSFIRCRLKQKLYQT